MSMCLVYYDMSHGLPLLFHSIPNQDFPSSQVRTFNNIEKLPLLNNACMEIMFRYTMDIKTANGSITHGRRVLVYKVHYALCNQDQGQKDCNGNITHGNQVVVYQGHKGSNESAMKSTIWYLVHLLMWQSSNSSSIERCVLMHVYVLHVPWYVTWYNVPVPFNPNCFRRTWNFNTDWNINENLIYCSNCSQHTWKPTVKRLSGEQCL